MCPLKVWWPLLVLALRPLRPVDVSALGSLLQQRGNTDTCLVRERSHSGGKCGRGRPPSPARSACSLSASASSSSASSDTEERVRAMSSPPAGRPGVGGGRSKGDCSASGPDHSPQPGPSGLGSREQSAPPADRFRLGYGGRFSPTPSGVAEDDRDSSSSLVGGRLLLCRFTGYSQSLHRLFSCLFPPCCGLSLRTQTWLFPSSWKTRPSTGFSLFPVVAIGGTTGLTLPLFLVCIRSRLGWPPSP